MAEISMNVAANALRTMTTIASPAKEASSVSKTVTKKKVTAEQTKKQERVQEDNIERDIVAVSKDGDTVAVSKESVVDVQKTSETKELRENEKDTRADVAENEKRPIEMIEAPEIQPIEAPEITVVPTTFTGISDQRMEQLYEDGTISRSDYDTEMAAREATRKARIEAVEYYQDDAAETRTQMNRVEREDIMLERAFEGTGQGYTPEIRADVVTSLQQQGVETARRNEEDKRAWDYQFLA